MTDTLLEIDGLTVRFGHGRHKAPMTAVDGVSLTIGHAETVALVGESGSGKSTIGNVILGLVPPTAGSILFDGEDISHASRGRRRELTRDIQAVFQDPYGSLNPVRTVGQTLVEPVQAHQKVTLAQAREKAEGALRRVGLPPESFDRYPAQFSGGQRQRIAIARALVAEPRLIICDEPTSALDLSVQAQVVNLLNELQHDLGISYLFITHDLPLIRHVAHRVVVLNAGRVMEAGLAGQVCERPRHPYTQALLAAVPVPDPEAGRRRAPRPASSTDIATSGGGPLSAEPHRPQAYAHESLNSGLKENL